MKDNNKSKQAFSIWGSKRLCYFWTIILKCRKLSIPWHNYLLRKHSICFCQITIKCVQRFKQSKSHRPNLCNCMRKRRNCGASPEFISHKDDSTLQQQGGKDSYHLANTEAAEQTVKVHMLQSGVGWPPQLDDLDNHK